MRNLGGRGGEAMKEGMGMETQSGVGDEVPGED